MSLRGLRLFPRPTDENVMGRICKNLGWLVRSAVCTGIMFLLATLAGCGKLPSVSGEQGLRMRLMYGTYKVIDYETHHPELASPDAKKLVGATVVVHPNSFQDGPEILRHPTYEITEYKGANEEGNVPAKDEAVYWGFGGNRSIVTFLHVYSQESQNEMRTEWRRYEVMENGVLWEVSGPGIYIFKRQGE